MEDISSRDICEIFKDNMSEYAVAVNQFRAIPDARTGLKPIHKKILWEMYTDGVFYNRKYRKCAYMVGQVISRFSEHGDTATYEALVRLSQDWIQRYPLIDLHGNGGSQFGDSPAAMRYVEARLGEIAELGFFQGIDKNNIDWTMNYTNEEKEPTTLPAVFPGLFCIPTQGIGYACASNFLTFNLSEVSDLIKNYIETNKINLIYFDLASGGVIVNPDNMKNILKTGQGNITIDSTYKISKQDIVFFEFPFNVMYDDIIEDIINKVDNGTIQGIKDVRNDSGNGELKLTVICDKSSDPNKVAISLLNNTKLRCSYAINQTALVDNVPKLLNLKDMLDIYISHNIECIRREFEFDYNKTRDRLEIVCGLIVCADNIDLVVSIIRNSKNPSEASKELQSGLNLTEAQAKAILDMRLAKLNSLEIDGIQKKKSKLEKYLLKCDKVRSSEKEQKKILVKRLTELSEKFGGSRRTKISQKKIDKEVEAVSDITVAIDEDGYLKFADKKNDDNTIYLDTKTDAMLYLFSNAGKMYRVSIKDISQGKGTALGSILEFDKDELIMFMTDGCEEIAVLSSDNLGKRVSFDELKGTTRNLKGMPYIRLNDGKYVAYVGETKYASPALKNAKVMGKASKGVKIKIDISH